LIVIETTTRIQNFRIRTTSASRSKAPVAPSAGLIAIAVARIDANRTNAENDHRQDPHFAGENKATARVSRTGTIMALIGFVAGPAEPVDDGSA